MSGQEESALQAEGTGRALAEATGAESFPGSSEVVWDQARQLCSSSRSWQQDSACGSLRIAVEQRRSLLTAGGMRRGDGGTRCPDAQRY